MINLNQLRRLLATSALVFSVSPVANASGRAPIEAPFERIHGAIIVRVRMAGHGPFNMMLDSGADPSIVDLATARGLGMKIDEQGAPGSGSGTNANLAYGTELRSLELGALRVKRIDALAMDLSGIGAALGQPIHGVLGRSLMKGRVIQIDYPKRVVRFFAASQWSRDAAPDTAKRTTLAYRYQDDILMSGVKVDGKPAVANLDTGASSAFQIAPTVETMWAGRCGSEVGSCKATWSRSTTGCTKFASRRLEPASEAGWA